MKRTHSPETDNHQKRPKSSLAWLGAALVSLKSASHAESWHAAKQLVSDGSVEVSSFIEDAQLGSICAIDARICSSENAAAFPHMKPMPQQVTPQAVSVRLCLQPGTGQLLDADTSCCPGGFQPVLGSFCPYAVAALLQVAKQAQVPNQGSMQHMDGLPAWEGTSLQDILCNQGQAASNSSGSSGGTADPQQQQQQQQQQGGLHKVHDALVAHPTCFTGGLGLDAWQFEDSVTATADVHVASQRTPSMYGNGGVYGGRAASDPDKVATIEDAGEDLSSHAWFQNVQQAAMQQQIVLEPADGTTPAGAAAAAAGGTANSADASNLPPDIRRALMRAGIPVVGVSTATVRLMAEDIGRGDLVQGAAGSAAAAAAVPAKQVRPSAARKRVLDRAVKQWLTNYNGEALAGWTVRPKVINDAFDLLVGSDSTPGRPLSAVVLLLRGLWEYLHHHGLGRLLAKPFKLLLALRSVLLVGVIPLWARKAVCCQLELWERGLLWQHAATPLDANGGHVGLVHLLKVGKEVHQLLLHHWDEPHLSQLLSDAFSEQHSEGGSSSSAAAAAAAGGSSSSSAAAAAAAGGSSSSSAAAAAAAGGSSSSSASKMAAWAVEQSSLLQLRLQVLDAMGASAAYLELAMAGGAWREAINRLLTSKERSQLLKAVKLLTRHITSLPERLKYMSQIVQLDSLGAPERLEVTARLLLDLREQLHPVQHPVKVLGRGSRYAAGPTTAATSSHMWKVTLYSLQENPTGAAANNGDNRVAGVAAAAAAGGSVSLQRQHIELEKEWGVFLKLFLQTAAQALFKAGEESIAAHKDHLKDEGLLDEQEDAATAEKGVGTSPPKRHQEPAPLQGRGNFFCHSCNRWHDHEEPMYVEPAITTPQPGDPDWKLLDIDDALFAGSGSATYGSIPPEATSGSLTARSPAGYIQEQRVIDCYQKAVPVSFPQLLPLCGLDALCISAITTKLMEEFDAGGKLDTSLGIEPLRELLSHPVVEMGPGTVRLQAAIEAVVYASTMTPLYIPSDQTSLDKFYRDLAWALLGVGQRSLALLVSRARYKVAPSAKAAGELLEVAISCGAEAQAAAVDLILGKGCVKPLGPEDDAVVKEVEGGSSTAAANAASGGRAPSVPPGLSAAEYQMLLRGEAHGFPGLEDIPPYLRDGLYSDDDNDSFYSDDEDMMEEMYGPLGVGMLLHHAEYPPWEVMNARVDAMVNMARHRREAAAAAAAAAGGDPQQPQQHGDDPMQDEDAILISDDSDGDGDGGDAMSISGGETGSDSEGGSDSGYDSDPEGSFLMGWSAEEAVAAAEAAAEEVSAARRQREVLGHSPTQGEIALAKRAARLRRAADKALRRKGRREAGAAAAGGAGAAGTSTAAVGAGSSAAAAAAAIAAAAAGTTAAGTSAAAAAAAGRGGRERKRGERSHKHPHHRDASPAESDGLASFDTRELLGSDAAAVLQLRDTAESRGTAGSPAAAAAAGGAPAAAAADAARVPQVYDDDDDYGYRYNRPNRPVRNCPPAQPAPRPSRRPSKRHVAAATHNSGKAAAGGGGGGGGGGDDSGGDGGPSHADRGHKSSGRKHHHHRPHSRNRRSGSLDGVGDPQQQALVSDLFGISHASHAHPLRTLRVHIHRLAGLQLWTVAKYAAGRGADKQQVQRLGMAAWLSDGNNTNTGATGSLLRISDALRWSPVAPDQAGWLEATQQLKTLVNVTLWAPPNEPYGGLATTTRSWSALPCESWEAFVAQERYPASYSSSALHHDTPDANLAWLMALLTPQPSPTGGTTGSNSGSSGKPPPAAATAEPQAMFKQAAAAASTAAAAAAAAVAASQRGEAGQLQQSLLSLDRALASGLDMLEQALPGRHDRIAAALSYIPLTYQGPLSGYVFGAGPQGTGYYQVQPDTAAPGHAAGGSSDARPSTAAGGSSGGAGAGSSAAAEAAAAAAGGSDGGVAKAGGDDDDEDGSCVASMLQQLAHLSKGIRYGLPMLQLCHALMESGCREPCLELLPQALLPAGGTVLSLQLHTHLVTDMQELLPMVAKHGDTPLRVGSAVSYMLVTRRPLPAPLISDQEVLSGVVSWWLGLSSVLHAKPEEWTASMCCGFIQDYFNPSCVRSTSMASSNWQQLQRMLVTSILATLGGSTARSNAMSPAAYPVVPGSSSDPNVLPPAEGYQLLLQCQAVKDAHWTFRLYLARLCYQMRLAPSWSSLSSLLCPALSAAVSEHTSGWAPDEREPLEDMKAWKERRAARPLPTASTRAREWVAETLEWLSVEVLAGQVKPAGAAAAMLPAGGAAAEGTYTYSVFLGAGPQAGVAEKERLRADFVDTMAATLAGWCGPELLLLAAAMRPHNLPAPAAPTAAKAAADKQHQQQLQPLNALLQAGLLPRVGRADELSAAVCVSRGLYRTALRLFMSDRALLAVLPQELVRCLALSYWQQEATPEGFLTANEVLLRLEGASAAQTLALPGGSNAPAAAAGSSAGGSNGSNGASLGLAALGGLKSLASSLRSFVPGAAAGGAGGRGGGGGEEQEEGGAAMPQVHAVLLEQLDLVPSKGGIEAAGLRFMQLQRHAVKGDHAAALESIFSVDSSSSNTGGGNNAAGPASLSGHMEVVDAVLRLAADASSGNEALRSLMSCAAYSAIVGLESLDACSVVGAGPLLLAPLSHDMKVNVLKLCIWRLVRGITQRPPPIELRKTYGPGFVSGRAGGYGDAVYNRNNPPAMPSYNTVDVQTKWMNRTQFNSLAQYCMELGLAQAATYPGNELASWLCSHLERQEQALLWALRSLAVLQTGPQLEGSVVGLISCAERAQLEQLPVLMSHMGEFLKRGGDRDKMMWVYNALKNIPVAEKINRYIRRNVGDVQTLQRYLAKSTIAELQSHKITSMPWVSWELGTKAAQAQELAEWLYWMQVTWPSARISAGVQREPPSLYNNILGATGIRY